jgi:ribosomal protein L3
MSTLEQDMSLGLIGRKVGMTRLFTDEGDSIPVTVIDVSNNRVAQIKTQETDGYDAVQLAHGERRASRVTKAMAGHFAKAGVLAGNRSVKVMPVRLSAITLPLDVPATVTQDHTMCQVQLVWRKIQEECSQVSV